MRDVDFSGSALYIKICLNTSATLIINKCLNEFCVYHCRSLACNMFNLAPMLEKEKLVADGGNYANWMRNLRFVIRSSKKEYVLDQPPGDAPKKDATPEEVAAYTARSDDYDSVQCLMLTCMDPELQKRFA